MNQIYKEYRRKRKNQLIVALLFIPVFLILLFPEISGKDELWGMDFDTISTYMLIPVAIAIAYSIYNWRCPKCKKYLGRSINHKQCPRCGEPYTPQ